MTKRQKQWIKEQKEKAQLILIDWVYERYIDYLDSWMLWYEGAYPSNIEVWSNYLWNELKAADND